MTSAPVTHLYRRRALHQAEPMRVRDCTCWVEYVGVRVVQTIAWAFLIVVGLLCIVVTLAFIWGFAQGMNAMMRLLLDLVR